MVTKLFKMFKSHWTNPLIKFIKPIISEIIMNDDDPKLIVDLQFISKLYQQKLIEGHKYPLYEAYARNGYKYKGYIILQNEKYIYFYDLKSEQPLKLNQETTDIALVEEKS